MEYLILGCGSAAMGAVRSILDIDNTAKITMVSHEFDPFYIKPAMIDFITSDLGKDRLIQKKTDIFPEESVNVVTGKRAIDILSSENMVVFSDRSTMKYSCLLIATGSKPIEHPALCKFSGHIFYINKFVDAQKFQKKAKTVKKALVVGRGIVGLEAVRALHKLGVETTYCVKSNMLWNLDVDGVDVDNIKKKLISEGINLYSDADILDILEPDENHYRVIMSDKQNFSYEMIVSALGLEPNMPFGAINSIAADRGILVGEDMRTNIPNIFAAGDCARVLDFKRGGYRINFGWLSAGSQGEIAGKNMAGHEDFYIPQDDDSFFLKLYGKKILERW
jgi:NAD(P)H-nitrite reductase large subunit